jgi:hypothetical protein
MLSASRLTPEEFAEVLLFLAAEKPVEPKPLDAAKALETLLGARFVFWFDQ